ncbi:MAG: fused MFS/spermidine synthase [Candidatus Omnitrophica bacterium]|nr:fused MFS/spermidine synthase [Candidatus Omnitrophota bacterium]
MINSQYHKFIATLKDLAYLRRFKRLHTAGSPLQRRVRKVVFLLFLCSGISCLIYEVVWTRLLTVILGNTVFAVSAVLTVFMGGLALGSFCAGRIIDRNKKPLQIYAFLQIAIALSGFCLTSILNQTGPVYIWLHNHLAEYPPLLYIARYVFSFALLGIPATLMGATLPVLSKFIVNPVRKEFSNGVKRESLIGLNIGKLYALNTLGAAAGCYLGGFILIGNIGIRLTVYVASALSAAVGILAWRYQKRMDRLNFGTNVHRAQESDIIPTRSSLRLLILSAFAISGFAALGYEVIWTRILIFFLSNTVYAFCTMLTTFLTGIALGSLVFSNFIDRKKRLVAGFGLIEVAIGLYVLLSIYLFAWKTEIFASLGQHYPLWPGSGIGFIKAFALMFIPTFLLGTTFPIAGRIYVANFRHIGRSIGELYAWNTIGAIIGAAATGFVLMPSLGLENSLLLLCCLNLGLGIVLCAAEPLLTRKSRFLLLTILITATGLGFIKIPRNVFRHMHEVISPNAKIIYYKEDPVGTVCVQQMGRHRRILIDNIDVAGTEDIYLDSHKSLGHLPMLLHPNAQTLFVLGFGAGGTAYSMSIYPKVNRIDSAEFCPSVASASRLFPDINHDIFSNPKLNLVINDGRHFLLTTQRTYDVISVDLLLAACAGSGSLYTKEFYELCYRRLNDKGIVVQWLSPNHIPLYYLQIILRTAQHVFPYTSLWFTRHYTHLIIVASKEPLRIDFRRLIQKMKHPVIQQDLAEVHLDDPYVFLSYFIANGNALTRFVQGSSLLNTDDLPLLEYKLPFLPDSPPRLDNLLALKRIRSSILPLLVNMDSDQKQRLLTYEQRSKSILNSSIAEAYSK